MMATVVFETTASKLLLRLFRSLFLVNKTVKVISKFTLLLLAAFLQNRHFDLLSFPLLMNVAGQACPTFHLSAVSIPWTKIAM